MNVYTVEVRGRDGSGYAKVIAFPLTAQNFSQAAGKGRRAMLKKGYNRCRVISIRLHLPEVVK
jgi:hypothetical protein